MIVLTFFVVAVIYCFAVLYRRKQFVDLMLNKFRAPSTDPLLGHVARIPPNSPGIFKTFFDSKEGWFRKYGKNIALIRPLYDVQLFVSNPADVEKILANPNSKTARKADSYFDLEAWLGTGLLLAWGEKWFQRRKIITPTFHFNILEQFTEVMSKQSDILVQKLKPKVNAGDIDIYLYTTLFALDVICETSMGIPIDAQSSPDSEYVKAVKEITLILQRRFFSLVSRWQFLYDLTPDGRREKELLKILHGFTDSVILQRREQLLQKKPTDKATKMNFLDMLLNSTMNGKPPSNSDIREEVDTFMFEGHDTTTSGIAFALYQLSQHKDIQDRLYEELADIYGDTNHMEITYKQLADLRYLDMVVKEALRIRPSVPLIGRRLTEDTVIDGVNVPNGTNIIIPIYALHNDPDNFPNPQKFDPDRFDPSQTEGRHPFAYVPFSAGARNCIGQKFALIEIKLVIAKLIMHYELLPATEQKSPILQGDIVLKSADGICLRLAERKRNK
ncbi:unnamed protein product [Hermetia illucens]|uniref:Cytochrome P450 n=1 Tax=Hermetia illucens TaxID=343691 RepID=A0A7R8V066_HERIL|nr:probable cytochrome P450 4d14 [Hermetia illucens]CAD7090293.1 unnamed protein product [Hermetia illucens]